MGAPAKDLKVGESKGRGRGVFAARPFKPGEAVEQCPVVLVPVEQLELVDGLWELSFAWPNGRGKAAVALGFGSLYNHSWEPNARYDAVKGSLEIRFTALRKISKGEEIFVNYNGDPGGRAPLWFDAK